MSLVLGVEIIGEFKQLTAATNGAQKQLSTFNDKVDSASRSMRNALASIGVGLSFGAAINAFQDLTKAAIEDRKSQQLLAIAMTNTGKATAEQVKQAEKAITKMQFSASVADDQLRPAYQKLFIATKDVTQSNELLQIALDASAATGKGLDAVTQAMAKSLAGSDTALTKLIPSLRGSKDPINEMAKAFEGAAEEASKLDPYKRMETIIGDVQDRIGEGLLPALDRLAEWMTSPQGEGTLNNMVVELQKFLGKINLIIEGTDILKTKMDDLFKGISMNLKVDGLNGWLQNVFDNLGRIANPLQGLIDRFAWLGSLVGAGQAPTMGLDSIAANSGSKPNSVLAPKPTPKPTVILNVKATQTAKQITQTLSKGTTSSGTNINSLISGGGKVR